MFDRPMPTDANCYYASPFPAISQSAPKRYLANIAAFSRLATLTQVYDYLGNKLKIKVEDMRLWLIREEVSLFCCIFTPITTHPTIKCL